MTSDQKYPSVKEMLADARRPQRIEGPTAALPPTSHLVVGFDRCPASHRALRFAIELAAPLNAYLHATLCSSRSGLAPRSSAQRTSPSGGCHRTVDDSNALIARLFRFH